MILIFALSAAFHITIFYPIQHEFSIRPYAIFYLANGIGCALEREYYRRTGRKVGGWVGWIWTWSVLLISGVPVAEHEYSNGWAGVNRGELGWCTGSIWGVIRNRSSESAWTAIQHPYEMTNAAQIFHVDDKLCVAAIYRICVLGIQRRGRRPE